MPLLRKWLFLVAVFCLWLPSELALGRTKIVCPGFFSYLSSSGASFEALIAMKSFRKYYDLAENQPVVDAIAHLSSFQLSHPYQLSGRAWRDGSTLHVYLDGIGPPLGTPLSFKTISQMKAAMSGMDPNPFVRSEGINRTLMKAFAAVVNGIDTYLDVHSAIEAVVIETHDVQNLHLGHILEKRFNFKQKWVRSSAMGSPLYTYELELKVDRGRTNENRASQL